MRPITHIGVLTGGGDCPGMNAAVRAVVSAAHGCGVRVTGFLDGFQGLTEDRTRPLDPDHVSDILAEGGTVLGATNRHDPFRVPTAGGGHVDRSAAALAVLDTIERDGLMEHAVKLGEQLSAGIAALEHPLLSGVRGRGLWLAIVLAEPVSAAFRDAAQRAGFLVNNVQPDAIRLAPALTMTAEEAQRFLDALPAILDEVAA